MKRACMVTLLVLLLTIIISSADTDKTIRVGLLNLTGDSNSITVNLSGEHAIIDDDRLLLQVKDANSYRFSLATDQLIIADDKAVFSADQNIDFIAKQTIIRPLTGCQMRINGTAVAGDFLLGETAEGKLIPVLILDIETYLRGVVPREMTPSRPLEALKAQAVAARTFSIRNHNRHSADGYDVCDTTHCQVYSGVDAYNDNSDLAIRQTAELCVAYQAEPARTFYHASSGGYLENSEDIFSESFDYLVAAADPYSVSDKQRWTAQFSLAELSDRLANQGHQIGEISRITIDRRLASGRVVALTIVGDDGEITLEKEKIRAVFGYNTLKSLLFWFADDSLYYIMARDNEPVTADDRHYVVAADGQVSQIDSSNFSVAGEQNKNGSDLVTGDFVVNGRGWGHGLGMSQAGAVEMAEQGFDFRQILQFYYQGTEILEMDQLQYENE